jgi:hypothetical protein
MLNIHREFDQLVTHRKEMREAIARCEEDIQYLQENVDLGIGDRDAQLTQLLSVMTTVAIAKVAKKALDGMIEERRSSLKALLN